MPWKSQKIDVLLLEDMEMDAAIIQRVMSRAGMEFSATVVADKNSFIAAISSHTFDVILSDNYLPQFDAMSALEELKARNITTPLILVTGTASEEHAVSMMKAGVWDYILKDRLQRLPNAIFSAIEKHRLATEHQKYVANLAKNEALLKEAERLAHIGSWEADMANGTITWSDEHYRILGYEPGEVAPSREAYLQRVHPDDLQFVTDAIDKAVKQDSGSKYHCRIMKKNGQERVVESQIFVTRDEHKNPTRLNGFILDVTERKMHESRDSKPAAESSK